MKYFLALVLLISYVAYGASLKTVPADVLQLNVLGGHVNVSAASPSSTYVLVLPGSQGAVGTYPKNDGSGNLSWVTPAAPTYPIPTASLSGVYAAASVSGVLATGNIPNLSTSILTSGTIAPASLASVVTVPEGGTGVTSITQNGFVLGNGVGAIQYTMTVPYASTSGVQATISTVSTASLSGVVASANGGGGGTSYQASINNLSGLTTKGDLEVFDGTNTTRLSTGVGANGYVLSASSAAVGGMQWLPVGGTGTVTSINVTASTGGVTAFSGGPITTSGTFTETVSGTSGGIPYFNNATSATSSAVLAKGAPVVGGGAGGAPSTIATGGGVLIWNYVTQTPSFGAVNLASAAAVTGLLPTADGGTNASTYAASYGPLYVGLSGTSLVGMAAGSTSQVIVGAGSSSPPVWGSVPAAALPAASTTAAGSVSYEDSGTFSCTLTGPCSTGALTVTYVRTGKTVSLSIPAANCSSSSATHFTGISCLPSGLTPPGLASQTAIVDVQNAGSTTAFGIILVTSGGNIGVFTAGENSFNASGQVGWGTDEISITYMMK
jgi:hypothetical protein